MGISLLSAHIYDLSIVISQYGSLYGDLTMGIPLLSSHKGLVDLHSESVEWNLVVFSLDLHSIDCVEWKSGVFF